MEEKIKTLKEKFEWLYDEYKENGELEIYTAAFSSDIYILPPGLDEDVFWGEMAEIIAKEHSFDMGDSTAYSNRECKKDNEWLEKLRSQCSGKINIEYEIKGYCAQL